MEEPIKKVPTSVSDYVDGRTCLICDIEFQSPIIAIKHAKMNHLDIINTGKVHIFWEGHNFLQNLHLNFFVLCSASQKEGGDFAKFFAFSEYMNFRA